jgi:hypothetical protein
VVQRFSGGASMIKDMTIVLVRANDGDPVKCVCLIVMFYFLFNLAEAQVEYMVFGERFTHWLDFVFIVSFITYAAYAVLLCAAYKSQ